MAAYSTERHTDNSASRRETAAPISANTGRTWSSRRAQSVAGWGQVSMTPDCGSHSAGRRG